MNRKKIVVIGAKGYIGKHLCNALAPNNDIIQFSSGTRKGISPETGLFSEPLILPENIDTVYYLAQSPRYRQMPQESAHLLAVNCVSAVHAAEAARKANAKKFIYASTGNVYEPSFSPMKESDPTRQDDWYAFSKVMAENALMLYTSHLNITIARIFGVYGPAQTDKLVPLIAERIKNNLEIMIDRNPLDDNDLAGLAVSLIYIDDLVKALIALQDISDCQIINLSGQEAISIRQLTNELAISLGKNPQIKIKDSNRNGNLIANNTIQTTLIGTPCTSFKDGIRLCY